MRQTVHPTGTQNNIAASAQDITRCKLISVDSQARKKSTEINSTSETKTTKEVDSNMQKSRMHQQGGDQ